MSTFVESIGFSFRAELKGNAVRIGNSSRCCNFFFWPNNPRLRVM